MPEDAKIALITGITGQDGSYLTELLWQKGYNIHGVVRPAAELTRSAIAHLLEDGRIGRDRLFLHRADLFDASVWRELLHDVRPTELYHLAAPSRVGASFGMPESTFEQIASLTGRLLDVVMAEQPSVRVFHASTAEIFGDAAEVPQTENTPLRPVSPYGRAKAAATETARTYRGRGLFICNGILYNHESPRRGEYFVTRKIARAVARIAKGLDRELVLGNLDSRRDWGHAQDYVRAMWLMLQHGVPDDYIVATGETHSVREFVETAFAVVDLPWQEFVRRDASLNRPADPQLVGDAGKIRRTLGWQPTKSFQELVREMVEAEVEALKG
jgi:GDPmannose 4,6-dehydratase